MLMIVSIVVISNTIITNICTNPGMPFKGMLGGIADRLPVVQLLLAPARSLAAV